MGATLTFTFSLSKHGSLIDAGASVWVDTNDDGSIADENRVDMTPGTDSPLTWTATSVLKVASSTDVGFSLHFTADPTATWSLVVKSDEAHKTDPVYEMNDQPVQQSFRKIMGWCK